MLGVVIVAVAVWLKLRCEKALFGGWETCAVTFVSLFTSISSVP